MIRNHAYRFICLALTGLLSVVPYAALANKSAPITPVEPAVQTAPTKMFESQDRSVMDVTMPEASYILGSGDEISVEDVTMGKLSTGQTKILTDGTVDLPLIGQIQLAGFSLEQAQDVLNEKYRTYFVNPTINIQVLYAHPMRVYVKGAVQKPGVYVSGTNTQPSSMEKFNLGTARLNFFFHQFYLVDLLIQAGGLKPNANIKDIVIRRTFPQPQTIHVNLWELIKSGQTIQDLSLREQDIVEISYLPKDTMVSGDEWKLLAKTNFSQNFFKVNIMGAVLRPGTYEINNSDNILEALAMAGGFAPEADGDAVYVLRTNTAGQVFKKRVNLEDRKLKGKGKNKSEWVSLLPEDVIFVDESTVGRMAKYGRSVVDKASGAAMLPYFNQLLRDDEQ